MKTHILQLRCMIPRRWGRGADLGGTDASLNWFRQMLPHCLSGSSWIAMFPRSGSRQRPHSGAPTLGLHVPGFLYSPVALDSGFFFFKVALASKTDFPKSLIFVNLGRHKEENYLWSYHLEKTIVGIGKYLPRVFVCDLTVYLIRNTLYILFGTFPSFEFFNVYHVISLKHF